MTNKEKAQYIALYYGQYIKVYDNNERLISDEVISNIIACVNEFGNYRLLLKDFYKISDADAIEFYLSTRPDYYNDLRTKGWKHEIEIEDREEFPEDHGRWIRSSYYDQPSSSHKIESLEDLSYKEVLYLISKGYALPWGKYTVQDLVDNGFVVLKS